MFIAWLFGREAGRKSRRLFLYIFLPLLLAFFACGCVFTVLVLTAVLPQFFRQF